MKKLIKGLFSLLFTIIIIAVVLVGIVVALAYDNSEPNVVEQNEEISTLVNTNLEEGTQDTKQTNNVNFLLTEEDLEYILYPIITSIEIPEAYKTTINGFKVEVIDEEFILKVNASCYGFPTSITAQLAFYEYEGKFTININNLKLGKLGLARIGRVVLKNMPKEMVDQALVDAGIYCELDLEGLAISFSKDDIIRMAQNSIDSNDNLLISLLIDIFFNNTNLLELNLGEENMLGAILHLSLTKYNSSVHGELNYAYSLEEVASKTESLLNSNIIEVKDTDTLFNYILRGYDIYKEDNEKKAFISSLDLSSIGITNNESYKGVMNKDERTLSEMVNESIGPESFANALMDRAFGVNITQEMIESIFNSMGAVGFSYSFGNHETKKVGYITFSKINVRCLTNTLDMSMVINVRGVDIYIRASFTCNRTDGVTLHCEINTISIGSIDLTSEQKDLLIHYLSTVIKDLDWVSVDINNRAVDMDFTRVIENNTYIGNKIEELVSLGFKQAVSTRIENGYINIAYSFSLIG